MSREYCFKFKCASQGNCELEEEENCAGCDWLYDCEGCVHQEECEKECEENEQSRNRKL